MPAFKLTAKAKTDLKKIAIFTQKRWGRTQRNSYLLQFDQCFHLLADNPSIGSVCNYIKPGYRKFPQGSHLIFYLTDKNGCIEIIRILHKNMDVNSKFRDA
ncbi:MAG: type II toxin-antitoxin system RelE/ParE family toxin [Gammaproteobacteria bacterium]|nr:type II toxin-antitoxin system RelE/ParE family toxin [Gammaproteobacteria bacterium]